MSIGIHEGRAVHVPGQADALQTTAIMGRRQSLQGIARGVAPAIGMLLGPAVVGPLDREADGVFGQNPVIFVGQDGLERRGAKIQSDKHQAAALGFLPMMIIDRMSSSVTSSTRSVPIS